MVVQYNQNRERICGPPTPRPTTFSEIVILTWWVFPQELLRGLSPGFVSFHPQHITTQKFVTVFVPNQYLSGESGQSCVLGHFHTLLRLLWSESAGEFVKL